MENIELNDFKKRVDLVISALSSTDDLLERTTTILSLGHSYYTSYDMSRELNHAQGKRRLTYNPEMTSLIRASQNDIQDLIDIKTYKSLTELINLFTQSLIIVNNMSKREAELIKKCQKVLIITIMKSGYISILNSIKIPEDISDLVTKVVTNINESLKGVFNSWVTYITENEPELLDATAGIDSNIFIYERASTAFKRCYGNLEEFMKDYNTTYNKFLECRQQFQSYSTDITLKDLCIWFEIDMKTFLKTRNEVFLPKFRRLCTDMNCENTLKLLIFGL